MRITLAVTVLIAMGAFGPAFASGHPTKLATFRDVYVFVTGYNTVPEQTDDTPCIAASGINICGRTDAVACPRQISLGTVLQIRGSLYVCEDRLAKKYDHRFDISCDKDMDCPNKVTGWVVVRIFPVRRDPGVITPTPVPAAEPAGDAPIADAAIAIDDPPPLPALLAAD